MNDSGLTKYRFLFIFGFVAVFFICFFLMNLRFDRLSRYPYEDAEIRKIIDETMTDEEIDYLIEYAIAPGYFREYISCTAFNIYHVDYYNIAMSRATYLSKQEIVDYVEEMISAEVNMEEMLRYLRDYSVDDLRYYYLSGDPYLKKAKLLGNPHDMLSTPHNKFTLGRRVPYDLMTSDISGKQIILHRDALFALEKMLQETELSLLIDRSYISYDEQKELYESGKSTVLPGQNDAQTGYSLRWAATNSSENLQVFEEKAASYGFVRKERNNNYSWRYVGVENALKLFAMQCFDEVMAEKES